MFVYTVYILYIYIDIYIQYILSIFQMAQRMAAVVWNAPFLLMFLFVCSVFSHSITISFTRNKLLDIRQHTADNSFPFFCLFRRFVGCFGRRGSSPSQTRAQTEKREACRHAG